MPATRILIAVVQSALPREEDWSQSSSSSDGMAHANDLQPDTDPASDIAMSPFGNASRVCVEIAAEAGRPAANQGPPTHLLRSEACSKAIG